MFLPFLPEAGTGFREKYCDGSLVAGDFNTLINFKFLLKMLNKFKSGALTPAIS
jgi:hypothetical protein